MIFNSSAKHCLIFISLQMLLLLRHWPSQSPFQLLLLPKKLFLTTPVLVKYPFYVFPLPEYLSYTVPQLPVNLHVFHIRLFTRWGQWLCQSFSLSAVAQCVAQTGIIWWAHEWARKEKLWEYIKLITDHIKNEKAEG